jgi:tripartite-type tricarboxylate transporter receptor subunit TctC
VSGLALGQDYPNRQIIILVGIAAGGITDVTTRQYAAVVSKNIDQNIIIENRPVAGGAVAAAAVQSAAPDGYTLLSVVGSQFSSVPAMGPAPYDPVKGFAPISLTFRLPTLLVVPMDSPAKTVAELLAWGKTKPGGLLLGSPGAGTPGHLLAAKIALATNTPISIHPLSRRRAGDGRSRHRARGFQPRLLQQRPVEYGRQEATGARGGRRDAASRAA